MKHGRSECWLRPKCSSDGTWIELESGPRSTARFCDALAAADSGALADRGPVLRGFGEFLGLAPNADCAASTAGQRLGTEKGALGQAAEGSGRRARHFHFFDQCLLEQFTCGHGRGPLGVTMFHLDRDGRPCRRGLPTTASGAARMGLHITADSLCLDSGSAPSLVPVTERVGDRAPDDRRHDDRTARRAETRLSAHRGEPNCRGVSEIACFGSRRIACFSRQTEQSVNGEMPAADTRAR